MLIKKHVFAMSSHSIRAKFYFLDGTDAKYYLSRRRHSLNWIIHLQAGGSCITLKECKSRAEGPLGSTLFLEESLTGEYTLSNDPNINPTFHEWNKIVIPYCSGDVFVGRKAKKKHPFRIPMLGHYIIVAVVEDLMRKFNINDVNTKVSFLINFLMVVLGTLKSLCPMSPLTSEFGPLEKETKNFEDKEANSIFQR